MIQRAALCAFVAGACGASVPDTLTLAGPGFTLEVARAPFRFAVTTDAGVRLDGRSLGWAEGSFAIQTDLSPGYFAFGGHLTWHEDWVVTAADATADTLRVELSPPGGAADVTVTFRARASALRVEAERIAGAPRGWAAELASPAGEGFLGMGERFTRTNFRGLALYSFTEEGGIGNGEGTVPGPGNPTPHGEAMTYYPVPFFMSTRGYAFWLDTTWWNTIDFAAEKADAWRAWHIAPTLAFEIYVPIPGDARPWPYHLIDLFTARTGRPMLAPPWSFGPRRRINQGAMRDGVLETQAMRNRDLAITGMDTAYHFLPNGWRDDTATLRGYTSAAHALGYKVMAYFNPFFSSDANAPIAPLTRAGLADGDFLLLAGGRPATGWILTGGSIVPFYMVDFTSPAAATWYRTQLLAQGLAAGYDGWMYDFAEYVPPDARSSTGLGGEELHNLYPVLYQKTAHEYLEAQRPGDWLTFVRSGYTGANQYSPQVWSGDPAASFEQADGLPTMVRAGVNIGIAGVPHWGGDIGGFHCFADGEAAADGELVTRWIQVGALEPDMHDEDACVGGGAKASIWTSTDAEAAWRKYARLHTRLFPYVYTLSRRAHDTGAPILRHVFLEHPDRPELASVDDAYYFGPALYVAPVVARGARQKTTVLPAGRYLDWDTRAVYAAGTVTVDAPLAKLPLFLREDHLVVLLDPSIDTLAPEDDPDIVGPDDVAGVYDVVGFVGGSAHETVWDGTVLHAARGAFAPPSLPAAASEDDLRTCGGCWRRDAADPGYYRLRVSATGDVAAGGVALRSNSSRRIRWDVVLAQ